MMHAVSNGQCSQDPPGSETGAAGLSIVRVGPESDNMDELESELANIVD
jgi:hypothetical protein